jgi:shikimate dehydrogenase
MKLSKEKGARVSNGLKMLEYQAEEAWSIWKAKNI